MNSENKICQNCKNEFIVEPDDFAFYQKMQVPPPTFCPRCRRVRRLAWLNDHVLYNRSCFLCKKDFISMYANDNVSNVLCPKCFHGDSWNPEEYGLEYDEKESFFTQFSKLLNSMPLLGVINDDGIASVNCLYNNDIGFAKNCTMCFVAWKMENCLYSFYVNTGKDLVDCHCVTDTCEFTYEGNNIEQVNRSTYMYWSISCTDCHFGYDLRGCTDCFMCFGLRNKQYYFKNKPYTKEEYNTILQSYELHTKTGKNRAVKDFEEFLRDKPRKYADLRNTVNCTGTDINRSKNVKDSNFAPFSEDSRYCHNGVSYVSCYDCSGGGETELSYECITPDHSYNSLGTNKSWKNRNVSYSMDTHGSEECFGCVGIKKGNYVILNKRYQKEEYFVLKNKIIEDMKKRGEYGEFIPVQYSLFGINETRAQDELNLTKQEALSLGFRWQDSLQETKGQETISQKDTPESIIDATDSILDEVLSCTSCQRNYKILKDELFFYRRMNIPIPEKCFFCRMRNREKLRGGFDLLRRGCECVSCNQHEGSCKEEFQTFFTKEKEPRLLYCEKCYQEVLD